MKWTSPNNKLPGIGELVLCYYKIEEYDYYVVGSICCINTSQYENNKIIKSIEWRDTNNEVIEPKLWKRFDKATT